MKGVQIDPPSPSQGKPTLKKPSLVRVKKRRQDGKNEVLASKNPRRSQRLNLIFKLTVCFVVNAAKRRIQSIPLAGGNITL